MEPSSSFLNSPPIFFLSLSFVLSFFPSRRNERLIMRGVRSLALLYAMARANISPWRVTRRAREIYYQCRERMIYKVVKTAIYVSRSKLIASIPT